MYFYTDVRYADGTKLYNNVDFFYADTSDTDTQYTLTCYVAGTLIRTSRGDVAVEALQVGDLAVTASGEARPIRWIGHRTVEARRFPDPATTFPVRIAAHAFGEGRPARDLLISPAHAVAVDLLGEVLIPACRLVNGTTITQEPVERITYWHVELDSHDILLAENLPAESYLDCGNRRFFAQADITDLTALPDARPDGAPAFCRPFHEDGPVVELVRDRLRERAEALGWRIETAPMADLHLVAGDRVIRADVAGLTARFVLPAETGTVRLVSQTSVPTHVLPGAGDTRRLGVSIASLTVDDGLGAARAIALDDPRLEAGFHPLDAGGTATWRWTDGAAQLPAALWQDCRGTVFLRVTLAGPALPRWVAPAETVAARREA
ncbi:hypothetical protein ASG52_23465 [Methylobacterium sp. Leaf456]|nr:hypothetical protein ASG52_23465 [Methylobacterium sp. Leaf456]